MEKQRKQVLLSGLIFLAVTGAFAQGIDTSGINEATQMVPSCFVQANPLIYAIEAIVGLIGGVKVYNKFSSVKISYISVEEINLGIQKVISDAIAIQPKQVVPSL